MYRVLSLPPSHVPYFFYPRVYRVTDIGTPDTDYAVYAEGATFMTKPQCYPASLEKMGSRDAFLIDNGQYIYLYLGNQVKDEFV